MIIAEEQTRELFRILICDEGYLAVRDSNPAFALMAPSPVEAAQLAVDAFDSLKELRNGRRID